MVDRLNDVLPTDVNLETALWLQFPLPITEIELLCATWLVGETLTYVWSRRKNRENVSIASLLAILQIKALHLSHTTNHSLAGSLIPLWLSVFH